MTTDARARLHAMFNLSETDEAELNARIDAVIAEETGPAASRLAAVEQVAEDARDKDIHALGLDTEDTP